MELLTYLLKVSACTVLFFGFYLLVLRRLTFFKVNRFYLLLTLVLSFVIPTLQFEVERESAVVETAVPADMPRLKPITTAPAQLIQPIVIEYQPEEPKTDWVRLIPYGYGGIALLLLLIGVWRLFVLLKYTKRYTKNSNGLKLIAKSEGFTNCSFFKYVFINEAALSKDDLAVLLQHEKVHAEQFHSVDKILMMIVKAVLWLNPIVYLYDRALEQAHEYEADALTSSKFGQQAYAYLLFKLATAGSAVPIVHNFVKSPVKDRIKMLFNSKSKGIKRLSYLLALPVLACLVWIFAVQVVYAQKSLKRETSSQDFPRKSASKNRELPLPDVKRTDPYLNSKEYLEKRATSEAVSGQIIKGIVGRKYVTNQKMQFVKGLLFATATDTLILSGDYVSDKGLESLNVNDKVEVKVSATYFGLKNEPYVGIIPETIKRNGALIYQKPPTKVHPFLYEANRVRFNDGKITNLIVLDDKKVFNIMANSYNFRITVDKTQTDLNFLNDYKKGDNVRLRFIHEVKTGDKSYAITDWVSISKNVRTFGVRNKKLFSKFYNEDGHQKAAKKKLQESKKEPEVISYMKLRGDVKNKITYMEDAVIEINTDLLKAKSVEWNKNTNILTANDATITGGRGNVAKVKQVVFDLNRGTYEAYSHNSGINDLKNKGEARNLEVGSAPKVEYKAKDSVKLSKDRSVVYLFGDAELSYQNIKLSGSTIIYNQKTNSARINNAVLTDKKNKAVKADSMYFDFATLKAKIFGADIN